MGSPVFRQSHAGPWWAWWDSKLWSRKASRWESSLWNDEILLYLYLRRGGCRNSVVGTCSDLGGQQSSDQAEGCLELILSSYSFLRSMSRPKSRVSTQNCLHCRRTTRIRKVTGSQTTWISSWQPWIRHTTLVLSQERKRCSCIFDNSCYWWMSNTNTSFFSN